ncbi:MAG: peptidylprolyl isomerase [Gemmataceae bacterium]|nr:peptidylprolyl isomerase [Gemmataceae bacterium]
MDAVPLRRCWGIAVGVAIVGTGCVGPQLIPRGQAPDEPLAPTGKIVIKESLPDPLAPAAPKPPIVPASATGGPRRELSALSSPLRDKQIQVAAFIGTDVVITDDEVWQMVRQRAPEYMELFGAEQVAKEKAVYREELRKLVERELIILELHSRMKKNKAEDKIEGLNDHAREQATRRLNEYRKSRKVDEADFVKILRAQGLTYNGLRRQLERDTLVQVFLEQMLKDKARFVTLNDIWDHYAANPKEFAVDEQVKWLDCFVSFQRFQSTDDAKEYAQNLWRQATQGGDFVEIVKKSSHGDSVLRNGEGLGTKKGEFQPAELESVLLELPEGQISPLLQTATGYHIVKVVESRKAGTRPFDGKVQNEIRAKLTRQLQSKEYDKMVDDLWRRYRPRVVEQ